MQFLNLPTASCKHAGGATLSWYASSKDIWLIYHFSLRDEGGVNKIYQFLSFFSLFLKIFTEAERFIISWISYLGWGSWHRSNISVLLALHISDFWTCGCDNPMSKKSAQCIIILGVYRIWRILSMNEPSFQLHKLFFMKWPSLCYLFTVAFRFLEDWWVFRRNSRRCLATFHPSTICITLNLYR